MSTPTLLVTGANGQLGRRVVQLLRDSGASVVAGSRDPSKLAGLAAIGASTRRIDFEDAASLAAGFAGIDRVLIVSTDALMVEGQRERQQVAAAEAAIRAGVKHVVYTSMLDPADNLHIPIAPSHHATERTLGASGVPHTILRNSWYAETLVGTLNRALEAGRWASAGGDARVSYVRREDCAEVAAAALRLGPEMAGTYDVTGRDALTRTEIAALVTRVTGRPLAVVDVSEADLAAGMQAAHVPQVFIDLTITIDRFNREGRAAKVSDTVARFTGRTPPGLGDFLAAHKAELVA